jgi:hypothetical protein
LEEFGVLAIEMVGCATIDVNADLSDILTFDRLFSFLTFFLYFYFLAGHQSPHSPRQDWTSWNGAWNSRPAAYNSQHHFFLTLFLIDITVLNITINIIMLTLSSLGEFFSSLIFISLSQYWDDYITISCISIIRGIKHH